MHNIEISLICLYKLFFVLPLFHIPTHRYLDIIRNLMLGQEIKLLIPVYYITGCFFIVSQELTILLWLKIFQKFTSLYMLDKKTDIFSLIIFELVKKKC